MKTVKHFWLKTLSMILTLALLISCVPNQVFAMAGEMLMSAINADDAATLQEAPERFGTGRIVREDTSKRGEAYKEYILNNGLRLATVYPSAIHYEDNGEWKDIDNTLIATVSDGNTFYTNTAGRWNVRFPQNLSGSNMIGITKDEFTIQFGMAGELRSTGDLVVASVGQIGGESAVGTLAVSAAQTATAQIQSMDLTAARAAAGYPETVLGTLNARLTYANLYPNTNVIYDLQGNQMKESIILQQYDSSLWGYRYTLDTGVLVPILDENQQINLCNPDTNEVVLTMPAPYMLDNNGEYNYDVDVSLVRNGSSYLLSYYLPREWLAEESRAWPVILDPIIEQPGVYSNIRDRTVYDNGTNAYNHGILLCGYSSKGIARIFLQYNNLPQLTSADVIVDASISLFCPSSSQRELVLEVHKVLDTWESETITWDNKPGYNTSVEDYEICTVSGRYAWSITDIVRDWYANENTGMMFKAPDSVEAAQVLKCQEFFSSDYNLLAEDLPMLNITFRNANGLEDYWDYTSSSAGRAGMGYVNNYNGNLVWIRSDIGFGGNRMPVSISHVYNANDSMNNNFGMGYGWRTNYNQRVYQWSQNSDYYVWEDGDGTLHYFYQAIDDEGNTISNTYVDEDGLYLTLTTGGTGDATYQLVDQYDNKSYFNASGYLVKIENNQKTKSSISIAYKSVAPHLIDTITDGAGRVYSFTYTNYLLTQISYKGTGSSEISYVTYSYTNSQLARITDKDGEYVTYSYGSKNLLLSAQDIDGYKLVYTYNLIDTTALIQPSRVATITEYDGTTLGGKISMEYANNQTTFTDHNGNKQIVQFNNWGNAVAVMDGEGRGQFASYNNPESAQGKGNQLRLSSKLQNTVSNLFYDNSFENFSGWTPVNADVARYISTSVAYYGSNSMILQRATSGETSGLYSSSYTVNAGESCTFSAYVKTISGTTAFLQLIDNDGEIVTGDTLGSNSDWTRMEVTYTNKSSSSKTVRARVMTETAGTVYIDCVQLEKTPTASRYNLIVDGDFTNGSSAWSRSETADSTQDKRVTATSAAPQLSTRAYQLTGKPQSELYVKQTVAVSGSEGDTFVLAGWAKGDSAPLTDENRAFCIRGVFIDEDGTELETYDFSFNPDTDSAVNWQYAAGVMIAPSNYDRIDIYLVYNYNVNTVLFDGIQLFKEEFGYSYRYNDYGNVTEVEDLEGENTEYTYNDDQDLTQVEFSDGTVTTFDYDDYHNLLKETSDAGVVTTYTYDAFGNNTSVSIGSGTSTITSTAVYTADGNRLEKAIDSAGKETKYGYNADTNVLEWVQYPEDTNSTQTEYTYDTMYRVTRAEVTTNTGYKLTADYTYTDDLLTELETASTTYTFGYGSFGLQTYVKAGSYVLADYSFTSRNNYLQELLYGNDDSVEYSYDSQGRVTEAKYYEDGYATLDTTITYKYDNNGALATVHDSATDWSITYYYDFTDRLVKYVEGNESYDHSIGYVYDDLGNLSVLTEVVDGATHTSTYTYDDDNRITQISIDDFDQIYDYDAYGRLVETEYLYNNQTGFQKTYTYRTVAGNPTGQVARLNCIISGFGDSIDYTYDDNGNITAVNFTSFEITYEYDSQNQLVRENNGQIGKSYRWYYDNAGNILKREEYAYTTGTLGVVLDTVNYTYGDSTWGDLLTAYDGATITYDGIGNPVSDGTWTYTWEHGRQLASMSNGTTTWTYTYDADGMRIGRTNGTDTYTYVYNGGLLTQMTKGSDTLFFTYDAMGAPATVTHNGTAYFYVTNLQGDVLLLVDTNGNPVVQYLYDAWGNLRYTLGSLATTLGTLNPLTYRGYVYDYDTGLYYLQSRYYNPEIGRFLNADDLAFLGANGTVLGYNLFAYCENNPIMGYDPSGYINWWKIARGTAMIVSGLWSLFKAATSGVLAAATSSVFAKGVCALVSAALTTTALQQHYGTVLIVTSIVVMMTQYKKMLYNIPKGLALISEGLKE